MTTITDDTQTEIIAKPYSKIRAAYDPIAETWKAAEAERPFLPITQEIAWKVINKSKRFLWGRRYTKISRIGSSSRADAITPIATATRGASIPIAVGATAESGSSCAMRSPTSIPIACWSAAIRRSTLASNSSSPR